MSDESAPPTDDYDDPVKAYKARQWEELTSGARQANVTRRIDYNPGAGTYTSQRSRRGGGFSRKRVILVARTRRALHMPTTLVSCDQGRREPRPSPRRTSAPTRAGPDDDDGSGDSEPSDPPLSESAACCEADRIAVIWPHRLTASAFYAHLGTVTFGMGTEAVSRRRVFCALPDRLQAGFYADLVRRVGAGRKGGAA
jgi:hypothetical protein